MSMLSTIRQTARGASVIADWVGVGGQVVDRSLAEGRSQICVGCEFNVAGLWWEKAKGSIAQAIRDMLGVKNECNLILPNEDKLAMCKACGCCNRLSVWTPIEHIKAHTSNDDLLKLPHACWKRRETIA